MTESIIPLHGGIVSFISFVSLSRKLLACSVLSFGLRVCSAFCPLDVRNADHLIIADFSVSARRVSFLQSLFWNRFTAKNFHPPQDRANKSENRGWRDLWSPTSSMQHNTISNRQSKSAIRSHYYMSSIIAQNKPYLMLCLASNFVTWLSDRCCNCE